MLRLFSKKSWIVDILSSLKMSGISPPNTSFKNISHSGIGSW